MPGRQHFFLSGEPMPLSWVISQRLLNAPTDGHPGVNPYKTIKVFTRAVGVGARAAILWIQQAVIPNPCGKSGAKPSCQMLDTSPLNSEKTDISQSAHRDSKKAIIILNTI
jgi:hypothetical protein